MTTLLVTFAGVAFVASVVPGPDTAVVVKNAVRGGRRVAVLTAAGCSTGQLVWGALCVLGIGALLAQSVPAFTVVKYVGAAYLLFLGVRALLTAGRSTEDATAPTPTPGARPGAGAAAAFREGLLVNALNPKTALFMSALLPQFLDAGSPAWLPAALVATTAAVSFTWMVVYAVVFSRLREQMRRPAVRRAVDRVVGVALVGLGVRLAAERA